MSTELEVKFLLSHPAAFISRLEDLGAKIDAPRIHETNLRFDTPDRKLTNSYQVLRLRQDARVRVTYKGSGKLRGGVRARKEIEFEAGDFEAAKAMFEALGYEVSFIYEKYRTTYTLRITETGHFGEEAAEAATTNDEVEIVVDETPLGTFTEIEGENAGAIQLTAARLGLDWEARINDSYTYLFEKVKNSLSLPIRDLTFINFEGVSVTPEAMKVKIGD